VADGAWFAAYFWSDASSGSIKLTDENSDGIYEGKIPVGMSGMLFCRMNPAYSSFSWNTETETDHVWNQTADTTVGVAPANYYYVIGWDNGEWNQAGYTAPETPVAPSGSDFALAGTFSDWGDVAMENNNGIYSAKNVTMDAYAELKVKAATSWDINFGAASVAYMNPGHHIVVAEGGDNIAITEAGTYDVYFDRAKLHLYVVAAGSDYTTAPLQSVNGKEPEVVAPEVTDNVVYLKPNSTWGGSGARFSAYLWNDNGNTWVSAVDADSDGIYEIYIPTGYGTNIIFCRMKNGTSANSWTNKQYQTVDLVIPTDGKNLFTPNEGGDKVSGVWSTK
jgi:putative component of toxin-antitoxin plasmid stabilization module